MMQPNSNIPSEAIPGAMPVLDAERVETVLKKHKKYAINIGLVFVFLGIIITAVSYLFASSDGGTYYILWGLSVYGVFVLIQNTIGGKQAEIPDQETLEKVEKKTCRNSWLRWVLWILFAITLVTGFLAIGQYFYYQDLEARYEEGFSEALEVGEYRQAADGSELYQSNIDGFVIAKIGNPSYINDRFPEAVRRPFDVSSYNQNTDDGLYVVNVEYYFDRIEGGDIKFGPDIEVDIEFYTSVRQGGVLISQNTQALTNAELTTFRIDGTESRIYGQIYVLDDRQYDLVVEFALDAPNQEAQAKAFFDSFRILN